MGTTKPESPPWTGLPAAGPMLRPKDAWAYVGFKKSEYYRQIAEGKLPKPIKMTDDGYTVATPRAWLDAFIAARAAKGGSE